MKTTETRAKESQEPDKESNKPFSENGGLLDTAIITEDELVLKAKQIYLDYESKTPPQQRESLKKICTLLVALNSDAAAEFYINELKMKLGISKSIIRGLYKEFKESQPKLPTTFENLNEDNYKEAMKKGYFVKNNSYYQLSSDTKNVVKISNFILHPKFHIYSPTDNKRLLKIIHEDKSSNTLQIESKKLVSLDSAQGEFYCEGNYIFFGSRAAWQRIISEESKMFQKCFELRILGHQPEGFFAFANGIFDGKKFIAVNDDGMTEFKNKMYFSPAFSNFNEELRQDDDPYENDRFFIYTPGQYTLSEWAGLMCSAYPGKAPIGIAYVIATTFRDIIFQQTKCFPHLFFQGKPESGKSTMAYSLSNFFFKELQAFNLSSGTMVGFFRRLSRTANTIIWFDEFKNIIDNIRFQNLKAAYDGVGHEKGKMTNDNRSTVTKIRSGVVISGEDFPTRDNNALFTRSILMTFVKQDFTNNEKESLMKLQQWEHEGLSHIITEILKYRLIIKANFSPVYNKIFDDLKATAKNNQEKLNDRMAKNFAAIMAPVQILLNEGIDLNFDFGEIQAKALELMSEQADVIGQSEVVSQFWLIVETSLFNAKKIEDGVEFCIKDNGGDLEVTRDNGEIKIDKSVNQLLYIRLPLVHSKYLVEHNIRYREKGIELSALKNFLKYHPAYLGSKKSYRFSDNVTSAWVFDYDQLNINLGRESNKEKSETNEGLIEANNQGDFFRNDPPY